MVLIPLVRISAKAAIVASTIYVTHKHGVWGDVEQGHQVAKKVKEVAAQVLKETGTPTGPLAKSKLLPDGTDLSFLEKLPSISLPSCDAVQTQATLSWNSSKSLDDKTLLSITWLFLAVDATIDTLRNAPQLVCSSLKVLQKWVRAATAPEDKQ